MELSAVAGAGRDRATSPSGLLLVDAPALEVTAEATAAALATEVVVLVIDARRRTVREIGKTIERLGLLGVAVLGVVLNYAGADGQPETRRQRRTRRRPAPALQTAERRTR